MRTRTPLVRKSKCVKCDRIRRRKSFSRDEFPPDYFVVFAAAVVDVDFSDRRKGENQKWTELEKQAK